VWSDLAEAFHRAAAGGVEGTDDAEKHQGEGRSAINIRVRLQGQQKLLRPVYTVLEAASTTLIPHQASERSSPFSPGEVPMFSYTPNQRSRLLRQNTCML